MLALFSSFRKVFSILNIFLLQLFSLSSHPFPVFPSFFFLLSFFSFLFKLLGELVLCLSIAHSSAYTDKGVI